MWGSIDNPWLDNVVANGLETIEPGQRYLYNGVGYDLAGKIMEVVSGKSVYRLMRENIFLPLGIETFRMSDMSGGTALTAHELARVGQMLLNRGAYGQWQFFSEETMDQLLPCPLSKFYTGVSREFGIGLEWRNVEAWAVEKYLEASTKNVLSKRLLGHGSATGSVLRIDLDNDLVIIQVRNGNLADAYERNLVRLLEAIDKHLQD